MTKHAEFQWWMLIVICIVPVFLVTLAVLPQRFTEQVRTILLYPVNSKSRFAVALRILFLFSAVGYLVVRLAIIFCG